MQVFFRNSANCGEGRIGHGTKTRVSAVYQQKDKIANFRDTINHRYSKAVIDFALKHQCGVIQMEDLSGIKTDTDFPKFLRHWTYYDLQSKIEAKAKENGIAVVKIKPEYTSQRCSRCGNIDPDNRKTQADFRCTSCGFHANADYNASQNIAIKNISEIISESIGAEAIKLQKCSHLIRGDFPSQNRESNRQSSLCKAGNTLEKVKMHIVIRA